MDDYKFHIEHLFINFFLCFFTFRRAVYAQPEIFREFYILLKPYIGLLTTL